MISEQERWRRKFENERRARLEAERFLSDRLRALFHSKQELQAANKELETFSYAIAHDLRAPLRHIDGFARVLLEDYAKQLDETGRDYLQRILAASHRMAELIEDILELAKVSRIHLRQMEVDLSASAECVAGELRRANPDRRVEFVIQPGLIAVGDARLLRLVLENLLSNAWKFTRKRDAAKIEFGAEEVEGRTAFFVRDNGVGFDPQYAANLFKPFERLHHSDDFEGTGIGLAIVKRVVERHGGRVWAVGIEGRGATFYFRL